MTWQYACLLGSHCKLIQPLKAAINDFWAVQNHVLEAALAVRKGEPVPDVLADAQNAWFNSPATDVNPEAFEKAIRDLAADPNWQDDKYVGPPVEPAHFYDADLPDDVKQFEDGTRTKSEASVYRHDDKKSN